MYPLKFVIIKDVKPSTSIILGYRNAINIPKN